MSSIPGGDAFADARNRFIHRIQAHMHQSDQISKLSPSWNFLRICQIGKCRLNCEICASLDKLANAAEHYPCRDDIFPFRPGSGYALSHRR